MHLADFEERLINSRIWTQTAQLEQRLADLNEHIEKVRQMYLRNEYETLAEYNARRAHGGEISVPRHRGFSVELQRSGGEAPAKHRGERPALRCASADSLGSTENRARSVPEELRKTACVVLPKGDVRLVGGRTARNSRSMRRHEAELATQLLQQIGKDSTDSYRVEMPFAKSRRRTANCGTRDDHRIARGGGPHRAPRTAILALGQGTRQHGLIAGKTGSGKSTLFHVIITNLALWCSPEQVEFYLVDFKKGVEFKCYATQKLPHARVIAIESDREFGLSVLQRVDDEFKRRGELFRSSGRRISPVTNVPAARSHAANPAID